MPARVKFSVAVGLLVLATGPPARAQVPPPAGPVTYQTFYDALSPYGQWVSDPAYGYVWLPAAGADFQPYRTNGHWVYTDYGWTWVSDYAWGWAPFHYGRWRFADSYGWVWVPGYSWGPAWVAWRQSAGYYGWAPLGPPPARPGVHLNIGLSFSFGDAPVAPARWCFVPAAYVASPRLATYYVPPARTTVVYNQTTVINNTYVNRTVNNTTVISNQGGRRGAGGFPAGPSRAEVEKATGQPLQPIAVTSRNTPGVGVQGKALAFYRPDVKAPDVAGAARSTAPAPRRTASLADAARQARAGQPGNGLVRDNTAQQLSSTDAQPVRAARQRAAHASTLDATTPATTDAAPRASRRNRQPDALAAPRPMALRPPPPTRPSASSCASSADRPASKPKRIRPLPYRPVRQLPTSSRHANCGSSNASSASRTPPSSSVRSASSYGSSECKTPRFSSSASNIWSSGCYRVARGAWMAGGGSSIFSNSIKRHSERSRGILLALSGGLPRR